MMESSFDNTIMPITSITNGIGYQAANGVYVLPNQIVNVFYIEGRAGFVVVDTGMPKSANQIISEAEKRFGISSRPQAIVLTHGHFDHVGAVIDLIQHWGIKVYAHANELPYLTGKQDYPPGDPTVDGGLISELSPMFPHQGIDLEPNVIALPEDGSLPFLEEWRYIETPGHTPGHISLFRASDRVLVAGDAFVTVKQESLYKVFTQEQEINGPPKYFTTDWEEAEHSVIKLAQLRPNTAITGHGVAMSGADLTEGMKQLIEHFQEIAVPEQGRFVEQT